MAGKRESVRYPLYAGAVALPHYDQYIPHISPELRNSAARWWTYGGMLRSIQVETRKDGGGELIKTFSGWGGDRSAASLVTMVEHAQEVREALGTRCVTGYGGAVRASLGQSLPVESRTHTAPYLGNVAGGWQEALKPGVHAGEWKLYDMQSAYYAALLEGLPDPASYRCTKMVGADGLYRVRLAQAVPDAPYPYNTTTEVLATGEEIAAYSLPVREVIAGVRWTRPYNTERIIQACDRWSFAKQARRAFWGSWISSEGVMCHSASGKSWSPLAPRPHPVWAHLILGRVRRRLWESATRAVHVYTDSVLTRDTLTCGSSPGSWRLVTTYKNGVRVGGAGQYGPVGEAWTRYAGVPLGDPRRMA